MKQKIGVFISGVCAASWFAAGALLSGCHDDVRTEQRVEIHEQQTEPEMVSPGEMIVE